MSRTALEDQTTQSQHPQRDAGRALYPLETAPPDDFVDFYKKNTADPRQEDANIAAAPQILERTPPSLPSARPGGRGVRSYARNVVQRFVFRRHIKGKTSTAAILLLLTIGGGGASFMAASPFFGFIQFKELLSKELNDQLGAMELRSSLLLKTKLKSASSGICGDKINIKCRMGTMTTKQVEKFKAEGITVERDMSKGFGNKRGQITSLSFIDPETKQPKTITTAQELQHYTKNNMGFRSMLMTGYNPQFAGLSDAVARAVLRAAGASKAPKLSGDTDEARQKSLNTAVEKKASPDAKSLRPVLDKDGKETGRYTDGTHEYSAEEYRSAQESSRRISASPGSAKMLSSLVTGVGIIGMVDTACTVFNTSRMVGALSKVEKEHQAIRFAMATVMTPADQLKAGDATEGDIAFLGSLATATMTAEQSVDETKWTQPGSAQTPPMAANPEFGKNMFDSYGYHLVQYGSAGELNARAQRFMLGGGLTGTLAEINAGIAKAFTGNPDPQEISRRCKYIQNPIVRIGSLAVGVVAGAGSAGMSTVATIAGSMALAMALPYLESVAADIIAGNLFKDLEGLDMGDAAFVGVAGMMGGMAMKRGMKPLNARETVEYVALNTQVQESYAEVARYQARTEPFNVANQYSFLGSLVRSVTPHMQKTNQTVASTLGNIGRLLPAGLASLTPRASALSEDRFLKCNDAGYAAVGIQADQFCNVRYGLSREELAMDPLANVDWMIASGNIDGDSEDGAAKDNGQKWNYVKFLKECVNRTVGWGEDQEENQGNGANCRAPEHEEVNRHFRVYTLDKTVDESMDAEPPKKALPGTTGAGSGATGFVSADGWAFPTTPDGVITSGYKSDGRPDHRGADIAQPGDAMGKPIFAARDGKVIAAGPASGFGYWIILDHGTVEGKPTYTLYGHMYNHGVLVQNGMTVKAGQEIGKIGNNGQSSGAHLHYEIWVNRSPLDASGCPNRDCSVDPMSILERSRTQAQGARNV